MTVGWLLERCAEGGGRHVFTGPAMVEAYELTRMMAFPEPMPPLTADVQRIVVTVQRDGWNIRLERGQA